MNAHTRRAWLGGIAGCGVAAAFPRSAKAATCSVPVDRRSFERYTRLFSSYDPAFLSYYADDVVLEIGDRREIKTARGVYEYFGKLRENFVETMDLLWFCSDATGIAAKMAGSYRCINDVENSEIFHRSIKKGEVRRFRGVVLYTLEAGKFKRIHGQKAELLSDWKLEA